MLDAALVAEAEELGIDISSAVEDGIRQAVAAAEQPKDT